jgi:uncharacterized membrane protein YhfC
MNTPANPLLYVTYPLSAILILTLAIGTGVYLTRRFRLPWRLYLIGGAIFVLSQVFHIPFNAGVSLLFRDGYLPTPPDAWLPAFNAIFLGLSAGLFEEVARFLGLRWWAKEARSWSRCLLYGAGHGGFEALFVGGLILLSYLVMVALQGSDLAAILPPDQLNTAQAQADAYWTVTWYDSILGFVERAFTLPVQISLSILVLQVFVRRQIRWLWFAIAWHALIDAIVVYLARSWNVYAVEGVVAVFAVASLGIIFALRQEEEDIPVEEARPDSSQLRTIQDLPPIEETPDRLEDTRYTE